MCSYAIFDDVGKLGDFGVITSYTVVMDKPSSFFSLICIVGFLTKRHELTSFLAVFLDVEIVTNSLVVPIIDLFIGLPSLFVFIFSIFDTGVTLSS